MSYAEFTAAVRILLLIIVFLVSIQSVLALWSQVGGQYHLDLMFWPWKLGITLAASALITGMARQSMLRRRVFTARSVLYLAMLVATATLAAVVTYYYHLHEPAEEEDEQGSTTFTSQVLNTRDDTLTWIPWDASSARFRQLFITSDCPSIVARDNRNSRA